MTKKKLKRIDLDVTERLLLTIYENVQEKKTNIARNAKMSYDKCVLYLEILETMGFVKSTDNRYKLFLLTPVGINFCKRIMDKHFENNKSKIVL